MEDEKAIESGYLWRIPVSVRLCDDRLSFSGGCCRKNEAVKPLIKCSTCGVEFTSQAGLEEHLKAHPEHKAAPVE
jgi:hypothetical protein